MTHTPGPWRTKDDSSIRATLDGKDVQIALTSPSSFTHGDPHSHIGDQLRDSCAANAHLLASAPALLEALLEMREIHICSCCSIGACGPTGPCRQCRDILVRADTAVRAAKGED